MTSQPGGLSIPKNPAKRLQELHKEQLSRTPGETSSADTEIRESVSTEARTDGSTEVSPSVSPPVRKEARAEGLTQALTDGRTEASTEGSADLLARVRAGLAEKRNPPGGVKATVDMSPDLATRAKRYSLDHGGVSTRQMVLVLLDAFLAEEGY